MPFDVNKEIELVLNKLDSLSDEIETEEFKNKHFQIKSIVYSVKDIKIAKLADLYIIKFFQDKIK